MFNSMHPLFLTPTLSINLLFLTYSTPTKTLINCGFSYCFIDSLFVSNHRINTTIVPPVGLCLFDGTSNSTITQIAELPIKFLSGEVFNMTFYVFYVFNMTFYVTLLDSSCSTVISYNWLKQYNPLIEWSSGHITLHSAVHRGQAPMTSSGEALLPEPITPLNLPVESLQTSSLSEPPPIPKLQAPKITFINAAIYMCASKLPGSITFHMTFSPKGLSAKATSTGSTTDL